MANRKQSKNRKQIKRQTRHFQLRVEHPIDSHVAEILDFKKSKRSEVTTIRDGVRLIWALENGDLSVLFDIFPQYKAQFSSGGQGGTGGSDLAREIAAQIVLMGGSGGYVMQSALPSPKTPPKPVELPPIAIVTQAEAASAESIADNFLNAAFF